MTQPATATTAAPAAENFDPALPLDRIELSKTNPRKHLTEESINEMAESIRMHGVAQPILVRPSPRAEAGWYELVFGERRFRASITAGKTTIPAMIRPLNDEAAIELQIIENIQREDVHELDEANGYKELIERGLYDVKSLSTKIGKSKEYIYKRLKLAGAVPEVQKLFYSREVTAGHVEQIARLPEVSQHVVLEKGLLETVRNGESQEDIVVSIRQLGAFISEHIHSDLEKAIFDVKDAQLLKGATACGDCPKRFGNVCADRVCFNQKINACVKAKVKAGEWVAATTDYPKTEQHGQLYWYYVHEAAAGSCPNIQTVICVEGHSRGQTKLACLNKECTVHFLKPKRESAATRSPATKNRLKGAPKVDAEQAYRRVLYQHVTERIDADVLSPKTNPLPIAKVPLTIIGRALLDSASFLLSRETLKDLGLPFAQKEIDAHIDELSGGQLAALIFKVALHPDYGEFSRLDKAAAFYKIDADRLKAEVLKQVGPTPKLEDMKCRGCGCTAKKPCRKGCRFAAFDVCAHCEELLEKYKPKRITVQAERLESGGDISNTYCLMDIDKGKLKGFIEIDGRKYVNTGGSSGGGHPSEYTLTPIYRKEDWRSGPTHAVHSKQSRLPSERCTYFGVRASWKGQEYILGPETEEILAVADRVISPKEKRSKEKVSARTKTKAGKR